MNNLKVTVFQTVSLDGRLTLAPDVLLLYGDLRWQAVAGSADEVYARLKTLHDPQVLLEGSGSFILDGTEPEPLPGVEGDPASLYIDFLPPEIVNVPGRKWMAVTDSRGNGRWIYKEFPGEAWTGWYLLMLVSQSTQPEYLAYLRREAIPYLVVGEGRVDFREAFRKLNELLGITRLVSTGGGRLNGALLRAGLIDELNIEFFPALIGGKDTPALFDGASLRPDEMPVRLKLISVQVQANGWLLARYQVETA